MLQLRVEELIVQLTLSRPHPGTFWKPLPLTGFSGDSLTWLKRHSCHRVALWLLPTIISGGSFSLLEGLGQTIWKFPSNTHVLRIYDLTPDAQILGGKQDLLGHPITPAFTDLFSGFSLVWFFHIGYVYASTLAPSCDCSLRVL